VQTAEIGLVPVRTRINGNLAEKFVEVGDEVTPGQALWRYVVSRQVDG
jgi:multidrug efflux pump subunit AcrA (membrane-fusion protein)